MSASDGPAEALDFSPYAEALSALIDHRDRHQSLTLAINAPWGAGKSHLAEGLRARLQSKPAATGAHPHVTCSFNAWMHDDATSIGAALVSCVAQRADRYRPFWRRVRHPLPSALCPTSERRWRRITGFFITLGLAVGLASLTLFSPRFRSLIGLLDDTGLIAGIKAAPGPSAARLTLLILLFNVALGFLRRLVEAGQAVSGFVNDPKGEAGGGSIETVKKQLGRLIAQATPPGASFVLFIDELEVCRPPQCANLLEAVSQLLEHPQVVTVLLADMAGVSAHADLKYKELSSVYAPTKQSAASANARPFGAAYLEKFVHLQFELPSEPDPARIRALIAKSELPRLPAPFPNPMTLGALFDELLAPLLRPIRYCLGEESEHYEGKAVTVGPRFRPRLFDGIEAAWRASPPTLFMPYFPLWLALFPIRLAVWVAAELAFIPTRRFVLVTPERSDGDGATAAAAAVLTLAGAVVALTAPIWTSFVGVHFRASSPAFLGRIDWAVVAAWSLVLPIAGVLALMVLVTRTLHSIAAQHEATLGALRRAGPHFLPARPGAAALIAEEQRLLGLVRASALYHYTEADDPYLPSLPRPAWRLVNRVRLLSLLADRHHLFGDDMPLAERTSLMQRWSMLEERWPRLAASLRQEPERAYRLELAAPLEGEAFDRLARELAGEEAADPHLVRFFQRSPPLSSVLRAFVRCQRAPRETQS